MRLHADHIKDFGTGLYINTRCVSIHVVFFLKGAHVALTGTTCCTTHFSLKLDIEVSAKHDADESLFTVWSVLGRYNS